MKNVVAFTVLLILAGLIAVAKPSQVISTFQFLDRSLRDFAYNKQIHFSGNKRIVSSELFSLLPQGKSVFWWFLNSRAIETALALNPLIRKAEVSRCGKFSWGCFVIEIEERQPEIMAKMGERIWLVGQDGGFMVPVQNNEVKRPKADPELKGFYDLQELPLVEGLIDNKVSPEIGKARYRYVKKAIELIESGVEKEIGYLLIKENGELLVQFEGMELTAVFNFAEQDFSSLQEEALRLKLIFREFGRDVGRIESVDLAFNKLGVVKFVDNK